MVAVSVGILAALYLLLSQPKSSSVSTLNQEN